MSIIKKVVAIHHLFRKKALLQFFQIHDMNAYNDIEQKYSETSTTELLH